MNKPKVVEYVKGRYNMRDKTLGDIVHHRIENGNSVSHVLFEVLGFLIEYDEIE